MYHLYNQTDRLRHVMLGTWFSPQHFDYIHDNNIRQCLQTIAEEVQEDLENFVRVLEAHDVAVTRPLEPEDTQTAPPLMVRDIFHVIEDTMYKFDHKPWDDRVMSVLPNVVDLSEVLNSVSRDFPTVSIDKYYRLAGSDWPSFVDFYSDNYTVSPAIQKEIDSYLPSMTYDTITSPEGPNIIVTKDEIIVDHHEYVDFAAILAQHVKTSKKWRSINTMAGHTDGVFTLLNRDTVLGVPEVLDDLWNYMPNNIKITWQNYQNKITEFAQFKHKVGGKWWVPGQENNQAFVNYVNEYLDHLVGYVEETVFDVNVLPLDARTVFVSNDRPEYFELLHRADIDAVYVPWRHRWFLDGGLHCITLDLIRQ